LEQAASDKQALQAMGQRGRELASKEFNREQLSNKFVDWLESVLHK
jgi:glycosyltransferase involved in cell wall biosynthesis